VYNKVEDSDHVLTYSDIKVRDCTHGCGARVKPLKMVVRLVETTMVPVYCFTDGMLIISSNEKKDSSPDCDNWVAAAKEMKIPYRKAFRGDEEVTDNLILEIIEEYMGDITFP
jgi:hypothetical protein